MNIFQWIYAHTKERKVLFSNSKLQNVFFVALTTQYLIRDSLNFVRKFNHT